MCDSIVINGGNVSVQISGGGTGVAEIQAGLATAAALATLQDHVSGTNGIESFPAAAAAANGVSLAEVVRYIQENGTDDILAALGTPTNTGGAATFAAMIGDTANSTLVARLAALEQQTVHTTAAKTVASIATANLFVITGGPVRILSVIGYLATAPEAVENYVGLSYTDQGSAVSGLSDGTDVSLIPAHVLIAYPLMGAGYEPEFVDYTLGFFKSSIVSFSGAILMPGTISMSCSATTSGTISWYVEFFPLAPGARVVAA